MRKRKRAVQSSDPRRVLHWTSLQSAQLRLPLREGTKRRDGHGVISLRGPHPTAADDALGRHGEAAVFSLRVAAIGATPTSRYYVCDAGHNTKEPHSDPPPGPGRRAYEFAPCDVHRIFWLLAPLSLRQAHAAGSWGGVSLSPARCRGGGTWDWVCIRSL